MANVLKPRLNIAVRHVNVSMSMVTNGTISPPRPIPQSTMAMAIPAFFAIEVMRVELAAGNRVSLPNLLTLQMTPAGVVETELEMPAEAPAAAAEGQLAVAVEPTLRAAAEAAQVGRAKVLFVVPISHLPSLFL